MKLNLYEQKAKDKICLAFDNVPSKKVLKERSETYKDIVGIAKVGMGTFTRFGVYALELLKDQGYKVFLDLKFLDIPKTVYDASKAAAEHGVYIFNVHGCGQKEMLELAVRGAEEGAEKSGKKPYVIGVTVLTSYDETRYLDSFKCVNPNLKNIDFGKYYDSLKTEDELHDEFRELLKKEGLENVIQEQVIHLTKRIYDSCLDGIVCSALDLPNMKNSISSIFPYIMKITPGIQGVDGIVGSDQSRVSTPGNAIRNGSDILVIGRALTNHNTQEERLEAGYKIIKDMAEALRGVDENLKL